MDELTPNEQAALDELVFELTAPHSLREIGARLRLSADYVGQIERRALDKLRRAAHRAEWSQRESTNQNASSSTSNTRGMT